MVKYIRGRGRSSPFHKIQMRRAVAAAVLLVCLLFAVPAAADTVTVSSFAELQNSITGAPTGEMRTIVIMDNIPVDGAAAIPAITSGKNITLTTSLNTGYSITRTGANTSTDTGMFTINSGGNLTICNNGSGILTLDGNRSALPNNNQPLVYVSSAAHFTATSAPASTQSQSASVTAAAPVSTTAAAIQPTLTQAPAPVAGLLFGLLAAGVLLRRRK